MRQKQKPNYICTRCNEVDARKGNLECYLCNAKDFVAYYNNAPKDSSDEKRRKRNLR